MTPLGWLGRKTSTQTLFVRLSVCQHVKVQHLCQSILINYKTKQPSNLAWNISLTSWLCDIGIRFSVHPSIRPSVRLNIYVEVWHLRQSILINHISTTTVIPCMTHLPDLLTYIDLVTLTYISRSSDFDTIYVDVPDLLNYKAYNYQTLHSASPRCTDSARALTRWPWPICCAPVTDTFCVDVRYLLNYKAYNHQTLESASSQCPDSADTLTWWPWSIFWLQWLWHNLCQCSRSPQV